MLQDYYTFYLYFAFLLNGKSVAGGKRKNGVIRGKRDGRNGEEDLKQCSKALERLRACDEWAGPQTDN